MSKSHAEFSLPHKGKRLSYCAWQGGVKKKNGGAGTTFITVSCGCEPAAFAAGTEPCSPRTTPSRHLGQVVRLLLLCLP